MTNTRSAGATSGSAPTGGAIAIGATAVAIARTGSPDVWRREITSMEGTSWPSLAAALREAVAVGAITSPARITLLPPLVEVRSVAIPPVGEEDAKRLLSRAASRHFVTAHEPMSIGVSSLSRGGAGTNSGAGSRLAAAIPSRVLRAVLEAARENALTVEVVIPAHSALAGSTTTTEPGDPNAPLLVTFPDTLDLVTRAHGEPLAVRRFRASGDELLLAEALTALGAPRRINDPMEASARALAMRPARSAVSPRAPWSLAFDNGEASSQRTAGTERRSWWLFGAAAALAASTVFLQELDVRRELTAVRAQRAALAPSLSAADKGRIGEESGLAALVDSLQRGPRWSRVLANLSEALPTAVHVTRLHGEADSLVLEGNAAQASAAYDALVSAPWVRSVVASAPVRRETRDDGSVTERFEFTLVLRGAQ